jgi:hypothetical protein
MAKAMGPSEIHRSLLGFPGPMYRLNPTPLIGPVSTSVARPVVSSASPEGYVGPPSLATHVLKGERGRDFDNIKRDITAVISMTQIF